jgi:EAL domain-containing protein (putative c-di-GMP-specific phosphodiesterase class I)
LCLRASDGHAIAGRSIANCGERCRSVQEFELPYQPVVDLATNDISGFEALSAGASQPGHGCTRHLIPLAEEIARAAGRMGNQASVRDSGAVAG